MLVRWLRRRAGAGLLPEQLGCALNTATEPLCNGITECGAPSMPDRSGSSGAGRRGQAPIATMQQRGFRSSAPQQLELSWLGLQSLIVDDASHKSLVQTAFQEKKLSFGFSGGGCLYPYYIGVVGALRDGGLLGDGVKVGGASAGSLIAACHASGLPLDYVTEQCLRFMHELRVKGARGRAGFQLERFLRDSLPQDAHERCRETAYVAVTQALPVVRRLLVSHFEDREDLIGALLASCHVPYWLDGRPYTEYRGMTVVDGGFTRFIPLAPQTVGIRVCCFPSKQMNPYYRIGISPDNFEPWPYTLAQMVQLAFNPGDERFTLEFIDKGKRDAQAWMEAMGLGQQRQESQSREQAAQGEVAAAKEAAGTEAASGGSSEDAATAAAVEMQGSRGEATGAMAASGSSAKGAATAAAAGAAMPGSRGEATAPAA